MWIYNSHSHSSMRQCVDWIFFFQAEDGIRYLVRSRGLGDVYKRQVLPVTRTRAFPKPVRGTVNSRFSTVQHSIATGFPVSYTHLTLPTSDLV